MRIAQIAELEGVQALAVHGRTRACGFSGTAEYETIRQIKQAVSVPVIANGDIDTPEKAHRVLRTTGADGVMIGRAAQGRPWLFREIAHYLETGERLPDPDPVWVRDTLIEHLEQLYRFYGRRRGLLVARKHIAWYSKTRSGGSAFRKRINGVETIEKQIALTREFFDRGAITTKELAA